MVSHSSGEKPARWVAAAEGTIISDSGALVDVSLSMTSGRQWLFTSLRERLNKGWNWGKEA